MDTFFTSIEVRLDGTALIEFGAKMPTQIFFVYGAVTYLGGVTTQSRNIIVPGNELNLYTTFKMGSNDRIERIRLDDLVFGINSEEKYLKLYIPGAINLQQSFLENPTLLNNLSVLIGLWYLPKGPDTIDLANRMASENVQQRAQARLEYANMIEEARQ